MHKPEAKLSRVMLFAPIALVLCCFGPVIFLLITTGAIVSYLENNKISLIVSGLLIASLIFLSVKYRHKNKSSC